MRKATDWSRPLHRLAALAIAFTISGCSMNSESDGLNYTPQDRTPDAVVAEIGSLSSGVYDMLHIKGKTTKPGPMASRCKSDGRDDDRYQIVMHPWSIYGVGNTALEQGMKNLAAELPKKGWKVVKNSPNNSRNRSLEILAVHLKTRSQMRAVWMRGGSGHEPLIAFDVYSRCFRATGATESATDY